MFTKFANLFNRINNRFTYRQRFIFFSFVYILTTPFPGYWLLQVENFFIQRSEWQLKGNQYQTVVGDMIGLILDQQISLAGEFGSQTWMSGSDGEVIKSSIQQEFDKIAMLNLQTDFDVRPSLGKGFSETPTAPIDLSKVKETWTRLIQNQKAESTDEVEVLLNQLVNQLQQVLKDIDNTFQLVVAPTETQRNLLESSLYLLPEAQELVTELFLLNAIQVDNPSPELDLKEMVLLQKLKQIRYQTHQTLEQAYSSYSQHITTKDAALNSARLAYTDYYASLDGIIQHFETNKLVLVGDVKKVLQANSATRESNILLTNALIHSQLSWFKIAKNFSLFTYILVALTLTFYIIFRVLTRHLMEICYHLRDMTKGYFKNCFCSHFYDEFGLIGRTFDKMGESVQDVLGELKNVGSQLSGSIEQITATAKAQEKNAQEQEKQVREIEETATLIATESRNLANTMNDLSRGVAGTDLADTAKEGLDRMQSKMSQLATASTDIITSLTALQEKVIGSNTLIAFLGKVSDQASLLSLNSAIETANIGKHKASFTKITHEIQRFAEKTSSSTSEIEEIISEIVHSVKAVRRDAEGCLQEISQGAHRLINVSNQLSNITKQGKEQIKKFENVNDVMQMQAIAAENIINSISHLGETAEENTKSIRLLHGNIEELGKTAAELQKTIGLFV